MKKMVLLFSLFLLPAFASSAQTIRVIIGNVRYGIRNMTATVIAHQDENEKYAGNIFVPATVEYEGTTYPVTAIAPNTFSECPDLISVTVAGNSISIGKSAFQNCPNLTSVVIPDSILKLGDYAFYNCTSLSYISPLSYLKEVGIASFADCRSLKYFPLPTSIESIGMNAFFGCESLSSPMIIPEGIQTLQEYTFYGCKNIPSVTIPSSVTKIQYATFWGCDSLKDVYCYATTVPNTSGDAFYAWDNTYLPQITLHVPAASIADYEASTPWNHLGAIVSLDTQPYRPFVEDGKIWKVGYGSKNPIQFVEYYYFDGDTIVDGRTCKQMMCQRYVTPDYPDYEVVMRIPLLSRSGVWYEEGKKVYVYNEANKQFKLMYDFSANANDTLQIHGQSYVIGPRQTGGIKGFKGVYRDVMMPWDKEQSIYNITWLEGVGSIEGPGYNVYLGEEYHGGAFLMSCTVGDEVIFLNDEYEEEATPAEARKRFDFTHTIKSQPKAPRREKTDQQLYGEYNDQQLSINLDPLDEVYLIRITDESGKSVYEKVVNAGNIVGLNIDISSYAVGRYTVTVENSREFFKGEFEAITTGIVEVRNKRLEIKDGIYNLQGQHLSTLRKGLNIVRSAEGRLQGKNGQKIFVK